MRRILLAAEFVLLFVAGPVLLALHRASFPPLPLLWLIFAYCLVVLLRDPEFERKQLWNAAPLRRELPSILGLFLLGVALIGTLAAVLYRPLLFGLVRTHPLLWALIMVLYPVLSVYPQGVIYRVFVMHRYGKGKPGAIAILLSACSFALMHVVFRNPVALILTFAGGLLFAWRQARTQSLLVSSIEHSLYGCLLFTVGLGQFFYARSI
ncbi:CPBP family intramembrane glutamic endopeptidase [Silvibacterium acidisoli]|uniref:CPBP family intramembrane glutamic endopeptidase n=1 Tax=Acidobacteriaceae bacterium ZG23-2 TaxID=2883246 RepID=UPI00406CB470